MFGRKYRKECDDYFMRSVNHYMYPQKTCKNTLSAYDEKRCDLNEIASTTWKGMFYEVVYSHLFDLENDFV